MTSFRVRTGDKVMSSAVTGVTYGLALAILMEKPSGDAANMTSRGKI